MFSISIGSSIAKKDRQTAPRRGGFLKLVENMANDDDDHTQIMLDAVPICCELWGRDGKALDCNQECVRVFGSSSKKEFCDRFFEFSPEYQPDGRLSIEAAKEYLEAAFSEGFQRFEWLHRKLDGVLMPSTITLVRMLYKHDYIVAGYIQDLTEHYAMIDEINQVADELRTARDAAESANNAKSMFLANMSHEIRTPLNVVVGLTDLHMEDDGMSVELKEDMKKINSAGSILLNIVNDVLDISKIEAGKLELTPVPYKTASLLNDIITLNIIRINNKPIKFNIEIEEDVPGDIIGDELRIKQIFNNLLSNAFKYTHEGSVTLRVRCERDGEKDLWMSIFVSDTGIGIRPEDVKRLFSDFNQVDTRANQKIEGTGLGLSITRKLVELMDGEISVKSVYGSGSTFYARIKQQFVSDKPLGRETIENLKSFRYSDNKQQVSSKLVYPDMSYARVLVVDDFQTNLDVASGLMRKYKIKVDCLTSGQAAIDRVNCGKPVYSAIFMDHMMPGIDGIEATKRIRELGTDYAKSVPIISLTANAIAGNEQIFLDSGFQAFLSKPINIMKLDAIIKKWVRDKSKETPASEPPSDTAQSVDTEPKRIATPILIPGIDTEKGLALYDGDTELYLKVLCSFAANTPPALANLRNVATKETLHDYAVNIHGLKGSCSNIGAEDARAKALHLEQAAKSDDISEVLAKNESMVKDAESLVDAINTWFGNHSAQTLKTRISVPDHDLLKRLQLCCDHFDMSGVDAIMEQLEKFSYDANGELIAWLRRKADISDFASMAARIKKEYGEEPK